MNEVLQELRNSVKLKFRPLMFTQVVLASFGQMPLLSQIFEDKCNFWTGGSDY